MARDRRLLRPAAAARWARRRSRTLEQLVEFYGDDDELHLAFNFGFINAPLEADAMRGIVEAMEALLPADAWPAWTGSNHDMFRFPTRWAGDDPRRIRAALVMLFGLRGTPVLYQGDEIGQGDTAVEPPDLRDPLGVRYWPAYAGRDAGRTPMQWSDEPGRRIHDTACHTVAADRRHHERPTWRARSTIPSRRSS